MADALDTQTVTVPDRDWFAAHATTFGDRLTGAREQSGMDQEEFALKLGIDVATLIGWEEDLAEPGAAMLPRMSGVLNISLRWLLTGEGDGPEGPDTADGRASIALGALKAEVAGLRAALQSAMERLEAIDDRLR